MKGFKVGIIILTCRCIVIWLCVNLNLVRLGDVRVMPLLMATCDNLMFVLCGNSKVLYVSI